MKLIRKDLEKDQSGTLVLAVEDSEDLWYIYNLITRGDEVEALTHRKIVKEGKKTADRVTLKLRIRVEKIEYDAKGAQLSLNGPTVAEQADVPLGSFHTMRLEPKNPPKFTLSKDEWDSYSLQVIEDAVNVENRTDIAAVVLQPGLAHICLVTEVQAVLRAKVEKSIPRKRRGDNTAQDLAMAKFLKDVYDALCAQINFDKIKAVLLAAPGILARQLYDFIFKQAQIDHNQMILKQKSKFVVGHASSGHLNALDEALETFHGELQDTRYGRETAALDKFFKSLNDDDGRAWYGCEEVEYCISQDAVATLMVTDTLFRSDDVDERHKYVRMVESVKDMGREVLIFSSMHPSGEQLDSVSGIACLTLFPMELDLDA